MNINRDNYEIWFLDYAEGNLTDDQVAELMRFLENHDDLKEELESFDLVTLPEPEPISFDQKEKLHSLPNLINRSNYENFFIAWVERTLTADQQAAVLRFVSQNPDLEVHFRQYQKTRIQADALEFHPKSSLRYTEADRFFALPASQDDAFIASHEGDLDETQEKMLQLWLADHPEAKAEYAAYGRVKLEAPMVVFPFKSDLKRKKAIVIPMWTYSAIAAAVVLLLIWTGLAQGPDSPDELPYAATDIVRTDRDSSIEKVSRSAPSLMAIDDQINVSPEQEEIEPDVTPNFVTPEEENPQPNYVVAQPKDSVPVRSNPMTPDTTTQEAIAIQEPTEVLKDSGSTPLPIAPIDEDQSQEAIASNAEFLTPAQLAEQAMKDRFFDGKDKIGVLDVAIAVTSNEKDQIAVNDNSTTERTSFSVQLGKFGFSQSRRKKGQ